MLLAVSAALSLPTRRTIVGAVFFLLPSVTHSQSTFETQEPWNAYGEIGIAHVDKRLGVAVSVGPSVNLSRVLVRTMAEVHVSGKFPVDSLLDGNRRCSTTANTNAVSPPPCLFETTTRISAIVEALVSPRRGSPVSVGGGFRAGKLGGPMFSIAVNGPSGRFAQLSGTARLGFRHASIQIGGRLMDWR